MGENILDHIRGTMSTPRDLSLGEPRGSTVWEPGGSTTLDRVRASGMMLGAVGARRLNLLGAPGDTGHGRAPT